MPRGDGTGPMGMGPMTGRGAGFCTGFTGPGYASAGPGRGFIGGDPRGQGYPQGGAGRGFRCRNQFYATGLPFWARGNPAWGARQYTPPPVDTATEIEALKAEAAGLESALRKILQRLEELTKEGQA